MGPVASLSLAQWGSIGTMVTAVLSAVVILSIYLAWRTYKSQVQDSRDELLSGMGKYVNEVALVFVQYPEMRKYFHGCVAPPGNERPRAEAIALTLANALDHVLVHLERIDGANEEAEAWRSYCRELRKKSPVMRELLSQHPEWYCRPLRKVFCNFSDRAPDKT
jgi:hypothetical protein